MLHLLFLTFTEILAIISPSTAQRATLLDRSLFYSMRTLLSRNRRCSLLLRLSHSELLLV